MICGLLLLNAVVGFVQEYHAGNIVASLKEPLALKAVVTRNRIKMEIKVQEVVPGDIVHLEDVCTARPSQTVYKSLTYLFLFLGHCRSRRWGRHH